MDLFLSDDEGEGDVAVDEDPEATLDAVLREVLDTTGDDAFDDVDGEDDGDLWATCASPCWLTARARTSLPCDCPTPALLSGRIEDVQEDPLVREALEKVGATLGAPGGLPRRSPCRANPLPDPTSRPITPQGLDLREYSKTIEKELAQVERASVDDCTPERCTGGRDSVPALTTARDVVAAMVARSTDINQSPQLEALQGQIKVRRHACCSFLSKAHGLTQYRLVLFVY